MPEMRFRVRWPDQSVINCYSPSLVIKEYLVVGESYGIADFVARSRTALNIASERVKQKYGMYCTAAAAELQRIERTAERFSSVKDAVVVVEGFS